MNYASKAIAASALAGMLVHPASAELIAVEDFEGYNTDTALHGLDGGTGWDHAWVQNTDLGQVTVVEQSLTYSNGDIQVAGGKHAARYETAEGDDGSPSGSIFASRNVGHQTDTFYLGMLFQREQAANEFVQVGFSPSVDTPAVSTYKSGGQFAVRSGFSGGTSTGVTAEPNSTYFIVMKISQIEADDQTQTQATLYLNPHSMEELDNPSVSHASPVSMNFEELIFRKFQTDDGNHYLFDEIRIGTSFESVVPEPASLGLILAGMGAIVLRRRTRTCSCAR